MNTTQQVTGTITTRGNKVIIMLQKVRTPYVRHKKQPPTVRDQHILKGMAQGLTNLAIAYRLGLREDTIKQRCRTIFKQLGVTNRIQAVLKWQDMTGYKFEFEYDGNHHQTLSSRELQVLEGIAEGDISKVIAVRLGIKEETVRKHTRRIFEKLVVRSRLQAALVYREFYQDKDKLEDLSKSKLER